MNSSVAGWMSYYESTLTGSVVFTARCYAFTVIAMGLCLSVTSRSSTETAKRRITKTNLEGKYSLESTDPRKSEIRTPPQPLPYLMPIPPTRFFITKIYHSLFVARTWQHFIDLLKRKNTRFTAFLDSNLHTRLAIVTKNELGLAFPPRNLPKKFRPDPSTFYLVIVVTNKRTNRQTDKPTPVIT